MSLICRFIVVMLAPCISATVRKTGWLDAVVAYQRDKLVQELNELPPVNFRAEIIKPPPNFVDSDDWTYESVIRLLHLLRGTEATRKVFHQVRRALMSRRFMRTDFDSFPSLGVNANNEIYYSSLEDDYEIFKLVQTTPVKRINRPEIYDDDIIVLSNPVEARLPSARISVRLLREILENRAKAAREMPTTKRVTIKWLPITGKSNEGGAGATGGTGTPGAAGAAPTAAPGA